MACIDEQRSADAHLKVKSLTDYHIKLLYALAGVITEYIRTGVSSNTMGALESTISYFENQLKYRYMYS